jgi:hypothetical protein
VYRTEEPPSLWEELAYGGGAHLTEEGSAMDTTEVGQVTIEVELVRHDCESRLLLEIESRTRLEVACCQEILHLLPHIWHGVHGLGDNVGWSGAGQTQSKDGTLRTSQLKVELGTLRAN